MIPLNKEKQLKSQKPLIHETLKIQWQNKLNNSAAMNCNQSIQTSNNVEDPYFGRNMSDFQNNLNLINILIENSYFKL